jgi:flagellar biosynthesis regulator FlaF
LDIVAFLISIAICVAKTLKKRPNSQIEKLEFINILKKALQMQIQTTCRTLPQELRIALTALSAIHIGSRTEQIL